MAPGDFGRLPRQQEASQGGGGQFRTGMSVICRSHTILSQPWPWATMSGQSSVRLPSRKRRGRLRNSGILWSRLEFSSLVDVFLKSNSCPNDLQQQEIAAPQVVIRV